ncbi:hypothetical protein EON83_00090 [bacterium]|nr:MAG: hypothetical protein EON83_00090 [bacterium]
MSLPIPEWFTLEAQEVAGDSRLKGHYLNAAMSDEDFIAEIERLIPIACTYVKSKTRESVGAFSFPLTLSQFATAYPDETNTDQAQRRNEQNTQASNAAKERIIYDLYRMLTGADNQQIATGCKSAADDMIAALNGDISETVRALQANGNRNRKRWGMLSMGYTPDEL